VILSRKNNVENVKVSQLFLVYLFQALCCVMGQISSNRNLVFVRTWLRRLSELLLFCRVVYFYLIFIYVLSLCLVNTVEYIFLLIQMCLGKFRKDSKKMITVHKKAGEESIEF